MIRQYITCMGKYVVNNVLQTMPRNYSISDIVNEIAIIKVNVHIGDPLFGAVIGSI